MKAVLFVGLVCSVRAFAADVPAAPPPTARLVVTGGVAARTLSQPNEGPGILVRGLAPTALHASGAYFFSRWLGVDVEARGELFYARASQDASAQAISQGGFSLSALPAFRLSPTGWLDVEGQVGWAVLGRPLLDVTDVAAPTGRLRVLTGPTAGVVAHVEPAPWLAAQVFGRVEVPLNGGVGIGGSAGVQARVGALSFGNTRLGVGVSYEFVGLRHGAAPSDFVHLEHRLGLGVALSSREPPPAPPPPPARPKTGEVRGVVVAQGTGAPLAGVRVEAAGARAATTDAQGRFRLRELAPGKATVRASRQGFKGATGAASITAGGTAELRLELAALTGPGRVQGVVKDADEKPLPGVLVRADGGAEVKTGDDGAFALERVGPGPVTVTAALAGYEKGEEVVQVPPEATATLAFSLKATGVKLKATIKGVVVGADGKTPRVTVRVAELKKTVAVKADGRFELEVPGGRYTLSLQAKGYVTQTKVVEVADGDQAIFHAELEKVRQ